MARKRSGTPLAKLKPQNRAYSEQRQHSNGYRDIAGLETELQQRGENVSWATAGRINKYLKEQALRITEKTAAMRGILDALGPNANDMGLVNIAMLTDTVMDMQAELKISPEEIHDLEPEERLKMFFQLVRAQHSLAQAQKPLNVERRVDLKEAEKKLAALEQAASDGKRTLDPETLRIVREQIYGFET